MQDTAARVLSCETMAQDLVRIILSAPDIAAQAKAGQFIHILVPDSGHVLRRPISLMAADAAAGTLTLAIQPKGAGTQTLCACKPGETIRVLGPLGTGFDGKGAQCVYFVGGGVGVAPGASPGGGHLAREPQGREHRAGGQGVVASGDSKHLVAGYHGPPRHEEGRPRDSGNRPRD